MRTMRWKQHLIFACLWSLLAACGGQPPELLSIGDKTVEVGETLEFIVAATDPDTATLQFRAERMPERATLKQFAPTQARFSWSPDAADVGDHQVDFFVSDGTQEDSERIVITVLGGSSTGPEFIGSSTWVIEQGQKSIEKIIEVRDDSASRIDWAISGEPEGAVFTPLVKRAVFFWEPTPAQRQQSQYSFTVTATNPDTGQSAERVYTIIIRDGGGTGCTGNKPQVQSTTPDTLTGANDFPVTATVTDMESSIQEVILRYATGDDPQPSDFTEVTMGNEGGTTWSAKVHLAMDLSAGEFVTVTYEICARDDDDPSGDQCDLQGCTGRLNFTARLAGGAGLCETGCALDDECGGPADLCLTFDGGINTFCGQDCSGGGGCPNGYTCFDLGGGTMQCAPDSMTCNDSGAPSAIPGELVINEVLADPPPDADVNGDGNASVTQDEFIEIVSVASITVDIGGFKISDAASERFTFPAGTTLDPGQAVVVFGGGDPQSFQIAGGVQVFSARSGGNALGLSNGGDEVQIRDRNFNLVASMSYGPEGANDQSLTLQPQVTGFTYVQHTMAPGANGTRYSPGLQSCGLPFPASSGNECGGVACSGPDADNDREPNDTRTQAACISMIPMDIEGALHYRPMDAPDPWDYYVFSAKKDQVMNFATYPGATMPEIGDTYLKILDPTGTVLVENDDPEDLSSLYAEILNWKVPADGTYYVAVGTYQGMSELMGSYSLRVE